MRRVFSLIAFILIIAGCATYNGPGSEPWYNQRLSELDTSYKQKEITRQEYFALRNEIDWIRSNYESGYDSSWPSTSLYYHHYYSH